MYDLKPDFDRTLQRMDAFWHCELIDRPVVQFTLFKPVEEQKPLPEKIHANARERWMDVAYQAELALASLLNQEFLGDSLPVAFPNLGPDLFAAFYGCELEFGDAGTSWSKPIINSWEGLKLTFQNNNTYWQVLEKMTDALIEIGKGRFLVGLTDLHPGGDCLAALRGAQNLAVDLLEHPEQVVDLMSQITGDYLDTYEMLYQRLLNAGQPFTTTWTPLVCRGKYYLPSCDFSIMVSPRMFERFFLPAICEEVAFLDHALYHLDGPGALRHLDLLLQVPGLEAIQFVPTEGDAAFLKWKHAYQRIQNAGKALQVTCTLSEIDQVMASLQPEGVYLVVRDVSCRDDAESMLKKLEQWPLKKVRI